MYHYIYIYIYILYIYYIYTGIYTSIYIPSIYTGIYTEYIPSIYTPFTFWVFSGNFFHLIFPESGDEWSDLQN
jgi:hypothetical protein